MSSAQVDDHSPQERSDVVAAVRGLRGDGSPDYFGNTSPIEGVYQKGRMVGYNGQENNVSPVNHNGMREDNGYGQWHRHTESNEETGILIVEEEGVKLTTLQKLNMAMEKSPDKGETLDVSRCDVDRVDDVDVEFLRTGGKENRAIVWRLSRLALSYNALRDGAIAHSFSRLSMLRYLNLKGNQFTQFPPALTDMLSLEILDLSKNRLTSFPENPGRLSRLKVLSLTNNKLSVLPEYLVEFDSLKVFKVGQNPIEWPPKEILGALVEHDMAGADRSDTRRRKDEDLRPWIANMKSWMRSKASEGNRSLAKGRTEEDAYLAASEEEPLSASSFNMTGRSWASPPTIMSTQSSQETIKKLAPLSINQEDQWSSQNLSPNQTKYPLGQRNWSAGTSEDSLIPSQSPKAYQRLKPYSHNRDASVSSVNTPPISASTSSVTHSRNSSLTRTPTSDHLAIPIPVGHNRGASDTATQRLSGQLTVKKSLPDLRQSHARIIQERRIEVSQMPDSGPLGLGIGSSTMSGFKSPSYTLSGNVDDGSTLRKSSTENEKSRILSRKRSADVLRRGQPDMTPDPSNERRNSQENPLVDESRNSYFRRMSMLPSSTISKAIPPVLLTFVDAIRGILFALSQVHSALRQYLLFAVNDRVAGMFSRVMEPASGYMTNLINALDRFDSHSRRGTPSVNVIRSVIDSAKESVALFSKIVSVLKLQVSDLRENDVRYTRTLLLMLYGSMAEVAKSWTAMVPLIRDIRPLLFTSISAINKLPTVYKIPPATSLGGTPISPIIERREGNTSPSLLRSTGSSGAPSLEKVPSNRSRRQGGSFSTQDVERGMLMASPTPRTSESDVMSSSTSATGSGTYVRHRPSASAQVVLDDTAESEEEEEEEELSGQTISSKPYKGIIPITPPELVYPGPSSSDSTSLIMPPPKISHHHQSSSSGSSHALSLSITGTHHPPGGIGVSRKLSVDVRPPTPTSATLFDEDLLDVLESATDIAYTVWLRLAEELGSSSPTYHSRGHLKTSSSSSSSTLSTEPIGKQVSSQHSELLSLLEPAEKITTSLRQNVLTLRSDPSPLTNYSQTSLPDDAQTFIKTVVKITVLVKTLSSQHTFSTTVRQSCSRLTQVTRECAILMQVSSLGPRRNTRPGTANVLGSFPTGMNGGRSGVRMGASTEELSLSTQLPQSAVYPSHGWAGRIERNNSVGGLSSVSGVSSTSGTNGLNGYNGYGGYNGINTSAGGGMTGGLRGLALPNKMALGRSRSAQPVPTHNG
ncbi:hypothetical protein TREMEDRAFT_65543 [Tremella mesenterica DSM 1558]|uniref:uncharacterized protein n=1 Tax=Tremella mesenterica (strain ATCC 24925 / CBS 8224 / DSM 1558 / NBRC 9311 / NRRL Y-6157 / RJB 2259-6 / UBC 559-6) TaxID=578456 RepID=UPI00032CAA10|nr:uncharacterized protein TREMEDRAFT_65543 [Tremella mesenterica DSM 1558]EIW66273.1 hypothetical protein TREMEDRAFT_65543 [Tremella mesenterica DSM 1558]